MPKLSATKILAVDNNDSMQDLLGKVFKKTQMLVCPPGKLGNSSFFDAWHDSRPFDIAIIDMKMPGEISGEQLIYQIRKVEPHFPIILISSDIEGGKRLAQKLGVEFSPKPFEVFQLAMQVERMVKRSC